MTRWGVVSTIKAPLKQIQDFAAWHLEQGAHRLYIYLDAPDPEALNVLKSHPKIRVRQTDDAYWNKRNGRPKKHQVRQRQNARHANNRKVEVDWMIHIDVDEFLMPATPLAEQLGALPPDVLCARIRPIEALAPGSVAAPGETLFKAFELNLRKRAAASDACFPNFGQHLICGFISHAVGKMAYRTGLKGLDIKIHNVALDGVENPGQQELTGTELAHFHTIDWAHFRDEFRFRLSQGSYRAELNPQVRHREGALSLHDLFRHIDATEGEAGLRFFFDDVCTATPELCARLEAHGLLRRHVLPLAELREKHFPSP